MGTGTGGGSHITFLVAVAGSRQRQGLLVASVCHFSIGAEVLGGFNYSNKSTVFPLFVLIGLDPSQIGTVTVCIGLVDLTVAVKVLGNGDLTKKLTVKVNAYSKTAKEKIEAVGGSAEEV